MGHWAENLISSPRILVYPLAKFQVSRPYGFGLHVAFYGRKIIIIIINIAASSNKRGSCFEASGCAFMV